MLGVYFAFLLLYSLVILQKGPTLLLTINMIACDQIVSFFSLEKVHPRCLKSCSSSLSSQTNSGSKTVRPAIKRERGEKGLWLWTYLPMDMGRMCYRKKSLLIHFCSPSLLFLRGVETDLLTGKIERNLRGSAHFSNSWIYFTVQCTKYSFETSH